MSADSQAMRQDAPYPDDLGWLVDHLEYRPGWRVKLHSDFDRDQGSKGLTLVITTDTVDSYPPHGPLRVNHFMPVPPAAYDRRSWQHWLLEQFLLVERHEACEFFTVDGKKPYAPHHYPGADPYMVVEVGTWEEADTDFRGNRGGQR